MRLYAKSGVTIHIGRAGENFATEVYFDITSWVNEFPGGSPTLVVQQNGATYMQTSTVEYGAKTANGAYSYVYVVWDTTKSNNATAGMGKCQLFYAQKDENVMDGERIVKSAIYDIIVTNSLGDGEDEPPAAYKSWVDDISQKADAILSNIENTERYATDAINSAAAAKVSETNAAESAADAEADAILAGSYREEVEDNAIAAAASAAAAKASENAAKTSETNAKTSETAAKDSEDAAKASELAAKASEDAAKVSEDNAADSEAAAKVSENNAKDSETNAAISEDNAANSEDNAADNALLSESWAKGGTGTRTGEDTNNSKYWADVAATVVAEGGVATWNGRGGNVMPETGDYTPEMVGTMSKEDIEKAIDATTPRGFYVTLLPGEDNWVEETQDSGAIRYYQTISDDRFISDGYAYLIQATDECLDDYLSAFCQPKDITVNGQIRFYADYILPDALLVKVLRVPSIDE